MRSNDGVERQPPRLFAPTNCWTVAGQRKEQMKVKIDSDEWYPVYDLDDYGDEVEVPDDKVAEWKRILAEFDVMQKEMAAYLNPSNDQTERIAATGDARKERL